MTVWLTRNLALVIGVGLAAFIVLAIGSALLSGSRAKVESKLNGNRADAAVETGRDAANTVANVSTGAASIDQATMENERAIREAQGADVPLNPDVHRAGIVGLCRYPAYRGRSECMQFTPSR